MHIYEGKTLTHKIKILKILKLEEYLLGQKCMEIVYFSFGFRLPISAVNLNMPLLKSFSILPISKDH